MQINITGTDGRDIELSDTVLCVASESQEYGREYLVGYVSASCDHLGNRTDNVGLVAASEVIGTATLQTVAVDDGVLQGFKVVDAKKTGKGRK